jgi:hypothetical protein
VHCFIYTNCAEHFLVLPPALFTILSWPSFMLPALSSVALEMVVRNTVAALIIEPLGSISCGRSKLEITERSQVFSPQMIAPIDSIISAATVCIPSILSCSMIMEHMLWVAIGGVG